MWVWDQKKIWLDKWDIQCGFNTFVDKVAAKARKRIECHW